MSASVIWDDPSGVALENREVRSPGPGELKIQVEASGLCGTDLHIASGEYPFARPGVTLGHEYAGRVVEVGPGVEERNTTADYLLNTVEEVETFLNTLGKLTDVS
jgi:D-arabinose 1-dehydrogenase-like Zn-dependent alcohol dehydrogenase